VLELPLLPLDGSVDVPPLVLDELCACAPRAKLAAHAMTVLSRCRLINLPFLLEKNDNTTRCRR
jgi:hypothetical protein